MRVWIFPATLAAAAAWLTAHAAETASGPQVTGFAPIEYFQNSCARCHGDYGSAYGESFGANLSETQLREKVHQMASGPAQAPLDEAQLDLESAFQSALRAGAPFVAVVSWTPDGLLSGEATPGTTLALEIDGKTTPIPLQEHAWQISLPPATSWSNARLQATKGDQTVSLPLAEHAFAPPVPAAPAPH